MTLTAAADKAEPNLDRALFCKIMWCEVLLEWIAKTHLTNLDHAMFCKEMWSKRSMSIMECKSSFNLSEPCCVCYCDAMWQIVLQ